MTWESITGLLIIARFLCVRLLNILPLRGHERSDPSCDLQGSAIDSNSNYVKCNLLKLLTIVAENGPSGHDTVLNALDHVKVRYANKSTFNAYSRCCRTA